VAVRNFVQEVTNLYVRCTDALLHGNMENIPNLQLELELGVAQLRSIISEYTTTDLEQNLHRETHTNLSVMLGKLMVLLQNVRDKVDESQCKSKKSICQIIYRNGLFPDMQ